MKALTHENQLSLEYRGKSMGKLKMHMIIMNWSLSTHTFVHSQPVHTLDISICRAVFKDQCHVITHIDGQQRAKVKVTINKNYVYIAGI